MKIINKMFLCCFLLVFSGLSHAKSEIFNLAQEVALKAQDPKKYLGDVITLGNSSFNEAQYIFLPEIHSDAESLLFQILVMALEQKNNDDFVVIDESIESLQKSTWELFSQKTLEVIAAIQEKKDGKKYSVASFENQLKDLTNLFQTAKKNGLTFIESKEVWSMPMFKASAKEFFGWDERDSNSLYIRNKSMVKTLKFLDDRPRVFVMLGARHTPQLDFRTSQGLMCSNNLSQQEFFNAIRTRKNLMNKTGIGTSLPIYDFLQNKKYAVITNQDFLNKIDKITQEQRKKSACINL